MSGYPKEVWLVCGKDGDVSIEHSESEAKETARYFESVCGYASPHLIARVEPEWKKPEEQKP